MDIQGCGGGMEIRVLKYFLAVASAGSITGAAKSLYLTQPTLTRQMKELEEELGHKLLVRGKHKVSLTREGMLLRLRAEEIMDLVGKTAAEFNAIGKTVSGEVFIGAGESFVMKYIVEVIREMRMEHKQIRFHLYTGNFEDVAAKMERGVLDFGVFVQPADISKYFSLPLPEKDLWGVLMRSDCALAQKEEVELEDLRGLPLIQSRKIAGAHGVRSAFGEWFGGELDKLQVAATYNLIFNAAQLVKAGVGYAICLDKRQRIPEEDELCFRPLKPRLESEVDIVWPKARRFSPATELFLERLQEKLG